MRYVRDMLADIPYGSAKSVAEDLLGAALLQESASGDAVQKTLRDFLAAETSMPFNDDVLARIRGTLTSAVREVIDRLSVEESLAEHVSGLGPPLFCRFAENRSLLSHVNAIVHEWQVVDRLDRQLAIDPTMPPLVERLIRSEDGGFKALALSWVQAQARWYSSLRQMQIAITELPAEIIYGIIADIQGCLFDLTGDVDAGGVAATVVRRCCNEAASRISLTSRLITHFGAESHNAFMVSSAGVSVFFSWLAMFSGQHRDDVAMRIGCGDAARLISVLMAAGLDAESATAHLMIFYPDAAPLGGFSHVEGVEVVKSRRDFD